MSWLRFDSYGSPGADLLPSCPGVRTGYQGKWGKFGVYHRYYLPNTLTPPFEFTGRMLVRGVKVPHTFEWGGVAGYSPSIVFHVMHISNGHNLVAGVGEPNRELPRVSAEFGGSYGFRTGYLQRDRHPYPDLIGTGWHTFRSWTKSHAEWGLDIDGTTVLHVVEKEPATMSGRVGVGLRLDFYDVELADLEVS